jgi:hypothetical protein
MRCHATAGQVSLLAQFGPAELRGAARRLAALLGADAPIEVTVDPGRGHLELSHVPGAELGLLTEWLHRRGARSIFVRYQHEGWRLDGEPRDAAPAPALN